MEKYLIDNGNWKFFYNAMDLIRENDLGNLFLVRVEDF